jgi:hypothetical protein
MTIKSANPTAATATAATPAKTATSAKSAAPAKSTVTKAAGPSRKRKAAETSDAAAAPAKRGKSQAARDSHSPVQSIAAASCTGPSPKHDFESSDSEAHA